MATETPGPPVSEAALDEWVRPAVAEFIGTFTLIFVGAGAAMMGGKDANIVGIALANGLAIGLMVAAAGHISGGVYNPSLVVGLLLGRRLKPTKAVMYLAVELLGAVVAALILKGIFNAAARDAVDFGTPQITSGTSIGQALGLEIVMTFFLMFVVYGTAIDARGPHAIAGLAIGLTITMDVFAGGAITGAAMNPARSFGPALVGNVWTDEWVYWVAPIIGAAIAALVYNYVLIPAKQQT